MGKETAAGLSKVLAWKNVPKAAAKSSEHRVIV
jgi:hypothetical protein